MSEVWDTDSLYELCLFMSEYELYEPPLSFGVTAKKTPDLSWNCSDFFFWACADAESILPSDIPELRKAAEDLKAAGEYGEVYAFELWVSRKRGRTPMGPWLDKECFDNIPIRLLFEEAGKK